MKEVLTKSFWQGVKKTFYEALESQPTKEDPAPVLAAGPGNASSSEENPSSPSSPREKQ
jgi:hypothetical protein